MTIQTRANLKTKFETGDRPTQSDYEDLIDSALNLADSSAQTITSPVVFNAGINFTTGVSSPTVEGSAATFGTLTVNTSANITEDLTIGAKVSASAISLTGLVSASAVNATSTISADVIYASSAFLGGIAVGPAVTSHGEIYLASAQATTISAAGGYSKSFGGTTLGTSANQDFSMTSDFTLRYTGAGEKTFSVQAAVSMSAAGNNKNVGMRLGKVAGGASKTEIYRFIGTGANTGAAVVQGLFELAQNQEVSLYLTNTTDTVAVTIHKLNMIAQQV